MGRLHRQTGALQSVVDVAAGLPVYLPAGIGVLLGQFSGVPEPITVATNASPIWTTSAGHGFTSNQEVRISGIGGNTAANGIWATTIIDSDSFDLTSSTGDGTSMSGGIVAEYFGATEAITTATNASPIQIIARGHVYATGNHV
jgi:hypothetical protein